ncbi:TIGR01777 family oxidoreductase [Rubripirellula sp.]|nr:TIGR01777 family oxidoreductase [Rubripirellula sp.]MDB4339034.1 TIGR01777 family oxidoreductase [Rubripirellula sp.]
MAKTKHFSASTALPVSASDAFAYHERPGALERLVPPWESVLIESSDQSLLPGSRVVLKAGVLGVPIRWVAEHTQYEPPRSFSDTQLSGPFAVWNHHHSFENLPDLSSHPCCRLTDQVEYKLPLGFLGDLLGGRKAEKTIQQMFTYRHRVTRNDLELKTNYSSSAMTVAISGSSGLVGGTLASMLQLLGHDVRRIVRNQAKNEGEIAAWSDANANESFSGVDAVVHLAGKSIADGRWNQSTKHEIRSSRVDKTRQLCERLAKQTVPPKVLICASATGIYGDRGDEMLDEDSASGKRSDSGSEFLTDVGYEWEDACKPATDAGIRVVHARFGIVLSPKGGALQKMLTPAKLMGGALGSGKQWWSWIALDDAVGAIYHCIQTPNIAGPVNLVSPHPIRNIDFAKQLGQVIGRPALFPAPSFVLRLALGEMADALLLSSTRVKPNRLIKSGYSFRFTQIEEAIRYSLGRERSGSETPQKKP